MQHENKLIWFDFLRGISAIVVVLGHLRAIIFKDFEPTNSIFEKLFYFLTGFGHQAVVIFFVLSGFFIIRSIENSRIKNRWNIKEYSLNRVSRLWIVLIPSLFMSLLLDNIGLFYFSDSYTYLGQIPSLPAINPSGKLGIVDFFGNLFFLQTILTPTYGSNGALWSLANEFWYYVLFPLAYFALIKHYNLITRIVLAILFFSLLYFVGSYIAIYFIVWLMGGITYWIIKKELFLQNFITLKLIVTLLLFFSVLALIRVGFMPSIFNDFSLGGITALLLCMLSQLPMNTLFLRKITTFFSEISYTLYLTHLTFAVFIATFFLEARINFSGIHFIYFALLFLIVFLYSFGMWFLFEKNTNKFKEYINKK